MVRAFESCLSRVEGQYRELCNAVLTAMYDRPYRRHIPAEPGIYVLYENGSPLYVGRTGDLRRRLGEHSLPGSDEYAATFAIALAREETDSPANYRKETTAGYLLKNNSRFHTAFSEAKSRIGRMKVRCVVETDPDSRYLLEFYAAKELGTPHNRFQET